MSTSGTDFPIGTILPIYGANQSSPPPNWFLCDGRTLTSEEIQLYPDFASVLGGDGKLPDLRGRTLICAGDVAGAPEGNTYAAQTPYGNATHKLTTAEMPSHQHFGFGPKGNSTMFGRTTTASFYGSTSNDLYAYLSGTTFAGGTGDGPMGTTDSGGASRPPTYELPGPNNSFSLMQASYAVNFFIYAGSPKDE